MNLETIEIKRIVLAKGFTDLRMGIDGLSTKVRITFSMDPTENGTLYLFCGRRRDRIKGLIWNKDGYLLLYKKLVKGAYQWPRDSSNAMELSKVQFERLMDGFSIESSIKIVK